MMYDVLNKIKRKWMKLRLQPIRVLCFHHVSDVRDTHVCQESDWTQLNQFKCNIEHLAQNHTFISLSEACDKLKHDWFRFRKYAVLTTDDGLAYVMNVIPWLEEKQIPLTLFVNTRYMEGDKLKPVHQKWLHELNPDADENEIAKRMYLSKEQIWALKSQYIEIGLHGHEHFDARKISEAVFEEDIDKCIGILSHHPRYIPAFAYTWGRATNESTVYIQNKGIVPVFVGGGVNYTWENFIDRECIDNKLF